ncbi:uncharacterized protein LOC119666118 [Teleopsis dalmanni]|uniref:uncharacterized protein LOC119663645 n=1 Tax=Teleopsis dalmanni TaxID=139649 RepID=UPI0018CCF27E|nr:uncharacterized protein LOC119663645 [Teleopsis dalmanni]XP_037931325.1 uncharacterized protein LOC119666118 [Teleopsis dalmanni]
MQTIWDVRCDKPRTCILLNININFICLSEFLCRDLVAIQIPANINGVLRNVVVATGYLPGDDTQVPSAEVDKLVNYCERIKLPLMLGCDSNAHNEVWGSTKTNIRGEYLLEFITSKKLEICNVGNTPTFVTISRKEVLDITIGNTRGCELVKNWRVSSEPSMSDHRILRFDIEGSPINKKILRNPRKTNWENYTENLKYNLVQLGLDEIIQNEIQLENYLENLNGAILNAYEDSCPLSLINSTKDVPWWNNDLKNLRNTVRGLFNYSKRTGDWSEYRKKTYFVQ